MTNVAVNDVLTREEIILGCCDFLRRTGALALSGSVSGLFNAAILEAQFAQSIEAVVGTIVVKNITDAKSIICSLQKRPDGPAMRLDGTAKAVVGVKALAILRAYGTFFRVRCRPVLFQATGGNV